MRYIGVDLHRKMFEVCVISGTTRSHRQYQLEEDRLARCWDISGIFRERIITGSTN